MLSEEPNRCLKSYFLSYFFFPTLSSADIVVDLTTPEAASFSEKYPEYEWMRLLSFADTGENLAITAFQISKDVDEFDLYIATISSSKKGKQKLYITIPDTCSEGDPKLDENTTIKTNEQNVMYLRFCDGKRVYLTPFSDAGNDFLINEF